MAIYFYRCESEACNTFYELEKSMNENFKPEQLICEKCKCDLKRDYRAEANPIIIPEEMRAGWSLNPKSQYNFDCRPSKRPSNNFFVKGNKK